MRSNKYDRFVWAMLGVVVAGLYFCSCYTTDQYLAAGSSVQVGYTDIGGNWSLNKQGDRHGDVQQYGTTISIEPFRWWGYKIQAEMLARAMTEGQYAQRALPDPKLSTVQTTLDKLGIPPKVEPIQIPGTVKPAEKPK